MPVMLPTALDHLLLYLTASLNSIIYLVSISIACQHHPIITYYYSLSDSPLLLIIVLPPSVSDSHLGYDSIVDDSDGVVY